MDWQANGLVRPSSVLTATEQYFADQDLTAQWLAEECDAEPGNRWKSATSAALFASWASRIPALSDRVGADPGVLGLALLAPAVGAVLAMPLVGRLLPARSSRAFCRAAIAGLMVAILLPGLAPSVPALAATLFLVGVANSTLDLAMNAQGVSIERRLGRPILSSLHAAFSFGGFAGAGLGALAAARDVAPLPHLALTAIRLPVADALWLGAAGPMTPELRDRLGIAWRWHDEARFRALSGVCKAVGPILPRRLKVAAA